MSDDFGGYLFMLDQNKCANAFKNAHVQDYSPKSSAFVIFYGTFVTDGLPIGTQG